MSLFKRPNSKYWWFKFTFDGQLVQKSTNVTNKRDAGIIESAFRTQLALGKIGIEPKKEVPTFEKTVDDFLQWSKIEHANQPNTYIRYSFSCQVLKTYFKTVKVSRIETKNIEDFIVWRSQQKSRKTGKFITRETVNYDVSILKMILKRLIDKKILRDNPSRSVKQLQSNDRKFHVLSEEEEKCYLLACPQPLQDVAAVMLETRNAMQ